MNTVPECVKKWGAMLEGLETSQADTVAWLLEQEVQHLTGEVDGGAGVQPIGERARVHLPVLRVAACRLMPTSAVDQLGRIYNWPQCITIGEVRAALQEAFLQVEVVGGPVLKWNPGEIGVGPQLDALADRVFDSLMALPGVV